MDATLHQNEREEDIVDHRGLQFVKLLWLEVLWMIL
jgi:hypothetical protein